MCARSDQPDPRDQAMDRLLARALKTPSGAAGGACPDAELIAAYADQGLSGPGKGSQHVGPGKGPQDVAPGKGSLGNDERAQLETHFSTCERCQEVLAALGSLLESPVSAPVAVMPAPAAAPATPLAAAAPAAVRPPSRQSPSFSPQRWLWWLSPAFGAAAAALLWMALRPTAPQPVQTAADYSAAAGQEMRALNAPAAPAEAPRPARSRDALAVDRFEQTESAAKESEADARAKAAAPADAPLRETESPSADASLSAATGAAVARSEITTAPAAPQAAVAQAPPAIPPPASRNQTATPNLPPSPQPESSSISGTLSSDTIMDLPLGGGFRPLPLLTLTLNMFGSPNYRILWRVGPRGRIERSTDYGKTWLRIASGVTSDLSAGAAVADQVAWIVGRGGVILRTMDGVMWQQVSSPNGLTVNWVRVEPRDALNATVTSADGRRFSTTDGGRTWTQQP